MAGADSFFLFEELDVEIERKLRSLEQPADALFEALMEELVAYPTVDLTSVRMFYRALQKLDFDRIYPNYLNHPLRVTGSLLVAQPGASLTTDDVVFGLAHNAIEAGVLDRLDPRWVNAEIVRRIQTVTIDRAREKQPVYRSGFYREILAHSPSLFIFKALDKLDNTLWWPKLEIESYHADVVVDEVLPVLEQVHPRLGSYLHRLIPYVLSPETKMKYSTRT